MSRDIGDLSPFVDLIAWLQEWRATDAANRPAGDLVVHTLDRVSLRAREALDAARSGAEELTPAEIAKAEGVSRDAIYKRRKRGKMPQATKRGGRIVIQKG